MTKNKIKLDGECCTADLQQDKNCCNKILYAKNRQLNGRNSGWPPSNQAHTCASGPRAARGRTWLRLVRLRATGRLVRGLGLPFGEGLRDEVIDDGLNGLGR